MNANAKTVQIADFIKILNETALSKEKQGVFGIKKPYAKLMEIVFDTSRCWMCYKACPTLDDLLKIDHLIKKMIEDLTRTSLSGKLVDAEELAKLYSTKQLVESILREGTPFQEGDEVFIWTLKVSD